MGAVGDGTVSRETGSAGEALSNRGSVGGGTEMREYPLTDDDLAEVGRRMARGESCIIPIRRDIELQNGELAENCLTWGSPLAYRIEKVPQVRGVLYYGRRIE